MTHLTSSQQNVQPVLSVLREGYVTYNLTTTERYNRRERERERETVREKKAAAGAGGGGGEGVAGEVVYIVK